MNLNRALGVSENTKLLMIHADDAGLSHSENRATIQALEHGIVNSYSIMVPCPWFDEIASFTKKNPQYDYGIHLTLTCEWENYRFGPVLPISEVPSLVDENGFFYKKREVLNRYASAEEVKLELQAQIEKAIKFGLSPTHIDSHMYSVGAASEFFNIYKDLGKTYNLPILLNKGLMETVGLNVEDHLQAGDFVVDTIHLGKFEDFKNGKLDNYYRSVLKNLSKGLNIILLHPAYDDNEMKSITINHPNFGATWRQIDFDFFTSNESKDLLQANNIQLVTWHDIKKIIQ